MHSRSWLGERESWPLGCRAPWLTLSSIYSLIIFVMGLTMLRIDRSKLKWKLKLQAAFDKKLGDQTTLSDHDRKSARSSKWTLFLLPMITVLREGLEAVVFIGGVSGHIARLSKRPCADAPRYRSLLANLPSLSPLLLSSVSCVVQSSAVSVIVLGQHPSARDS